MKRIKGLFILLAAVMFVLPITAGAESYNETECFTNQDFTEIEKALLSENVPEEKVEGLIEKLENGELWDSMKEEYRNIKPQIAEDSYKKTIYPDGSFVIDEVIDKTPANEKETRAIIRSNSVRIKKNLVLVGASFDMDYERNTLTNQARILSQYNKNVWTFGGTYSNLKSGYWTDWRSPTNAWMSFDINLGIGNIGASSLGWIKGYVNGSGHWVEYQ